MSEKIFYKHTEKYLWFDGKRYTRQEDGHYRGYHADFNPANNEIANLTL